MLRARATRTPSRSVLYNLMDNAVKFAAPGGTLCVCALRSRSGKAYVSVRDHGETIPPDDLPFIFDRFHKSDRTPQPRPRRRGARAVSGQEHPRRARRGHRRHEPRRCDGVRVHAHARKARAQAHRQAREHRPTGAGARVHELFAEFIECLFSIHKQHKITCYHQIVPWEGHHNVRQRPQTGVRLV